MAAVPSSARAGTVSSSALRVLVRVSTRVHRVVAGALALGAVTTLLALVRPMETRVQVVGPIHCGVWHTLLCAQPGGSARCRPRTSRLTLERRRGRGAGGRLVIAKLHIVTLTRLARVLLPNRGCAQLLLLVLGKASRAQKVWNSVSIAARRRVLRERLLGGARVHAAVVRRHHGIATLGRRCSKPSNASRRGGVVGVLGRHVLRISIHGLTKARLWIEILDLVFSNWQKGGGGGRGGKKRRRERQIYLPQL